MELWCLIFLISSEAFIFHEFPDFPSDRNVLKSRTKNSCERGENYFQLKVNLPNISLFPLLVALAELETFWLKNKKRVRRCIATWSMQYIMHVCTYICIHAYIMYVWKYMCIHAYVNPIQLWLITSTKSCLKYSMTVQLGKSRNFQLRDFFISVPIPAGKCPWPTLLSLLWR